MYPHHHRQQRTAYRPQQLPQCHRRAQGQGRAGGDPRSVAHMAHLCDDLLGMDGLQPRLGVAAHDQGAVRRHLLYPMQDAPARRPQIQQYVAPPIGGRGSGEDHGAFFVPQEGHHAAAGDHQMAAASRRQIGLDPRQRFVRMQYRCVHPTPLLIQDIVII